MARKLLRWLWLFIILLLMGLLLLINGRLYASGLDPEWHDVPAQLAFVRSALEGGAAQEMQQLFPEGYFFSYALYGLAWVNLGIEDRVDPQQALRESRWALAAVESPAGQWVFTESLNPPYGVFYVGWSNWLRAGILQLQAEDTRDPLEVARFQAESEALAQAFENSNTPFLQAYPNMAWPVDNLVAIASLSAHDRLFEPRYADLIERWLVEAQVRLDPATGLLPHRVQPDDGSLFEGARGSSQSVIHVFLPLIDADWAREHYARFRSTFLTQIIGIPGTLEYPAGSSGSGDVDSGPLMLGVSLSSSVVTVAAARANGDVAIANAMLDTGEALGLPLEWGEQKRYAFGLLPIGDVFVAWAKSTPVILAEAPALVISPQWRMPVHLISLGIAALLWWLLLRRKTHH